LRYKIYKILNSGAYIDKIIYVDSNSLKSMELGTQEFPYKTLATPLLELFNYLPVWSVSYTIRIKEGTTDNFKFLSKLPFILNANNVTIR
jgi:hypothetical protein